MKHATAILLLLVLASTIHAAKRYRMTIGDQTVEVELEEIEEPKPEPQPVPEPEPEPTPEQSHFEYASKLPGVVAVQAWDSQEAVRRSMGGGYHNDYTRVANYDPEKNAACWLIRKGEQSIPIGAWGEVDFPPTSDKLLAIQWEAFYDSAKMHGGKTFQLWDGGIQVEVQSRLVGPDYGPFVLGQPYQILHSFRTYRMAEVGGNGEPEQLSTEPWTVRNVQPSLFARPRQLAFDKPGHVGEGGKAYFVRPGQWTRYTLEYDLSQTPARLKLWIADENTDPTLVLCDPDDPALGFIAEPKSRDRKFHRWLVELNNSTSVAPCDCRHWVRNVIVSQGASIPLGGRP